MESQKSYPRVFSCEFFPPRTEEGRAQLRATRERLATLKPRFFSVTFGAGGSTRDRTLETALEIQQEAGIETAPHLSCIGSSRDNLREILQQYRNAGIRRLVALRGDLPSGMGEIGELRYANELVEFIRAETQDHFHIEVAAYPEVHPAAPSARADLLNFKRKVESGADGAITQYFYNVDAYLWFVESCEKVNLQIPIVPGIMPITNFTSLLRFSEKCGAQVPRWLVMRLEELKDDLPRLRAFGLEVVTDLCRRLLEAGAPGLHFYVLNRDEPTFTIWTNLGLPAAA